MTAPKLAFMHIPKTGGASLCAAIAAALPPDARVSEAYGRPDQRGLTHADLPEADVYCGHFTVDFIRSLPPGFVTVTLLRQPETLLLSLWNHIAAHPRHVLHAEATADGSSFASVIGEHVSTHNPITRYLLGRDAYRGLASSDDPVETALRGARENLARFDVVGITRALPKALRDIGALTGLDLGTPGHENPTGEKVLTAETMSEDDRRTLHRATRFDGPVFRMALEEFVAQG